MCIKSLDVARIFLNMVLKHACEPRFDQKYVCIKPNEQKKTAGHVDIWW
jgi:hypothetical protein